MINNNWWKKSIENKARSQQKCNFFQNSFSLDKIGIEIINTVKCSALNNVNVVSKVKVSMPSMQSIYPCEFIWICCSDCRCRPYILCLCYNFWRHRISCDSCAASHCLGCCAIQTFRFSWQTTWKPLMAVVVKNRHWNLKTVYVKARKQNRRGRTGKVSYINYKGQKSHRWLQRGQILPSVRHLMNLIW